MSVHKVALITGASSGIGELTARALVARGFTVFGTSRRPRPSGDDRIEMLQLDVTAPASIDACVRGVLARAGRIDLLVNNAGLTHVSLLEETPSEVARLVMDTNFWGVVEVTNAVLPTMRKQRSGVIINVGSLAGLVGVPGQGFYAASKHALEGYTETLQTELRPFHVRVALVEPGFVRTNLHHAMARDAQRIPDYDILRQVLDSVLTEAMTGGDDAGDVAVTVAAVAESLRPKLRYRVGRDAVWVSRLKRLLPEQWLLWGMRRRFRLDRVVASGPPTPGQQ